MTLQHYNRARQHWSRVAPPPYISLMMIASAHGAKFGHQAGGKSAVPEQLQAADPQSAQAIVAQFGGSGEIGTYVPPAKGLPINQEGRDGVER